VSVQIVRDSREHASRFQPFPLVPEGNFCHFLHTAYYQGGDPSVSSIAELTGVSRQTIYSTMQRGTIGSWHVVSKILDALGVDSAAVLDMWADARAAERVLSENDDSRRRIDSSVGKDAAYSPAPRNSPSDSPYEVLPAPTTTGGRFRPSWTSRQREIFLAAAELREMRAVESHLQISRQAIAEGLRKLQMSKQIAGVELWEGHHGAPLWPFKLTDAGAAVVSRVRALVESEANFTNYLQSYGPSGGQTLRVGCFDFHLEGPFGVLVARFVRNEPLIRLDLWISSLPAAVGSQRVAGSGRALVGTSAKRASRLRLWRPSSAWL